MSRIRQIKPQFFVDDDTATLGLAARLMFIGMWTMADREGRLQDKPGWIKSQTLPQDEINPDMILAELNARELIVRYVVDGKRYIHIPGFVKHQKPHPNEAQSTIPPPDNGVPLNRPEEKPNQINDTKQAREKVVLTHEQEVSARETGSPSSADSGFWGKDSGERILGSGEPPRMEPPIPIRPAEEQASDPLTPHGLIHLIRVAVEKAHPELGLYNAGQWGPKSARAFVDDIPSDRRTDALRSEIRRRIQAFANSPDPKIAERGWLVEDFCNRFNTFGQQHGRRMSDAERAAKQLGALAR